MTLIFIDHNILSVIIPHLIFFIMGMIAIIGGRFDKDKTIMKIGLLIILFPFIIDAIIIAWMLLQYTGIMRIV